MQSQKGFDLLTSLEGWPKRLEMMEAPPHLQYLLYFRWWWLDLTTQMVFLSVKSSLNSLEQLTKTSSKMITLKWWNSSFGSYLTKLWTHLIGFRGASPSWLYLQVAASYAQLYGYISTHSGEDRSHVFIHTALLLKIFGMLSRLPSAGRLCFQITHILSSISSCCHLLEEKEFLWKNLICAFLGSIWMERNNGIFGTKEMLYQFSVFLS